jgi:hypothetical protein
VLPLCFHRQELYCPAVDNLHTGLLLVNLRLRLQSPRLYRHDASRGPSAGGVNAGLGFTVRISDPGWRIFVEPRYCYAFHQRFPTTLIPVTFGIRFN